MTAALIAAVCLAGVLIAALLLRAERESEAKLSGYQVGHADGRTCRWDPAGVWLFDGKRPCARKHHGFYP